MDIKYTLPFDLTNTKYSNKICVCVCVCSVCVCVCIACMHACVCLIHISLHMYTKWPWKRLQKKLRFYSYVADCSNLHCKTVENISVRKTHIHRLSREHNKIVQLLL